MKPEDVTIQFAERTLTFDHISGQPTDSDIVRLMEALAQILLLIPYNEENGIHSLIGLIYSPSAYTSKYNADFPHPSKPGIYDSTILDNAPDGLHAMKEAIHKERRHD